MNTEPTTVAATRIRGFLEREPVVWLSTVRPDGGPHLVPIWFWWDGEALLVFSKPGAQKVRNLRAHPSVMLALGDAEDDFDVGLLRGRAELLDTPTREVLPAEHLDKYAGKLAVDRAQRRRVRGDLLAGHPDRARRLPALARPDIAAERPAGRRARRARSTSLVVRPWSPTANRSPGFLDGPRGPSSNHVVHIRPCAAGSAHPWLAACAG